MKCASIAIGELYNNKVVVVANSNSNNTIILNGMMGMIFINQNVDANTVL